MKVLITGANGFIGSHLCAAMLEAGLEIVGAVRDPDGFRARFPKADAVRADLNRDVQVEDWLPHLHGIDAVVNCAGILQGGAGQNADAIHHRSPVALFAACAHLGIRRVVQISAISATREAGTEYALTKLAADQALRALDLDWFVLRPSLVYAEGSYGGTSLLRSLAACPWVVPVVGRGEQPFQPLHVRDLARTILVCLDPATPALRTLGPVGPETLTLRDIVLKLRRWMGLPAAPVWEVPRALVATACRIGDVLQSGALRTTSLRQIEHGNTGDAASFIADIGFTPGTMDEALSAHPSQAQDRWHARLMLLRPVLTASLAVMWLVSGVLGLALPRMRTAAMIAASGLPDSLAPLVLFGTAALDIVLAAFVLSGRRKRLAGWMQLAVVVGYTMFLTITQPLLWSDPFGPLLKNLPILALILVWMVISEER